MDSVEKENERIRRLLETCNVSSDEPDDDDDDSREEDNLEVRHESTDTEQEMSDVASANELGTDGETVWKKSKPKVNVRTCARNIITEPIGVKGSAKNSKTPKDCWSFLFDESIINILVECTNKYINENKASCSRDRHAKNTSKEEASALIGRIYLAGVYKSGKQNLDNLWPQNNTGVDLFHTTTSLRRFKFLLQCIRCDDKTTKIERLKSDKLSNQRDISNICK